MDKIEVSILLPVFRPNLEYLNIAVNSIVEQEFRNYELLMLYESSEIDEAVERYFENICATDTRIKIIRIPGKTGLPKSLNIGIEHASGKYIARMDGDDYSYPERLRKQYEYMEKHPDVAVVGSSVRVMGSEQIIFGNYYTDNQIHSIRMLFSNAGVAHPTAFIRASFLKDNQISYNETIGGSEDYHLWGDIALKNGGIVILDQPLLEYRVFEEQASNQLKAKMVAWDNEARYKQFQAIGLDGDKIKEYISVWAAEGFLGNPEDYYAWFNSIKEKNCENMRWKKALLTQELSYQWMYKALLQVKTYHDFCLLRPKFILKHCPIWTWKYALQNIRWVVNQWKV